MPDQFTKKSILQLKAKIEGVYLPVFETLLRPYPGASKEGQAILKLLRLVDRLQKVVDDILHKGVTIATPTDAQIILKLTKRIEQEKNIVVELITSSELRKANDELGLHKDDLKISREYVKERAGSKQQQSTSATSKRRGGNHFDYGPTGSILSALGINSGKRVIGLGVAAQVAIPLLGPYLPAAVAGAIGLGAGVKGIARLFKKKKPVNDPNEDVDEETSNRFSGLGSGQKKEASAPLLYFFDKEWKKAKWTKDIHDFLRKGVGGSIGGLFGKTAGGNKGGMFSSMLGANLASKLLGKLSGGLTKVIPLFAPLGVGLGILTASAAALYFGFRDIQELIEIWKSGKDLKAAKQRAGKVQSVATEKLKLSSTIRNITAKKAGIDFDQTREDIAAGRLDPEDMSPESREVYYQLLRQKKNEEQLALSKYETENEGVFGYNKREELFISGKRAKIAALNKEMKQIGSAPQSTIELEKKHKESIQPDLKKDEMVSYQGRMIPVAEAAAHTTKQQEKQQELLEKIEQNTKKEETSPLFNFDNFIDSLDDLRKVGVMK